MINACKYQARIEIGYFATHVESWSDLRNSSGVRCAIAVEYVKLNYTFECRWCEREKFNWAKKVVCVHVHRARDNRSRKKIMRKFADRMCPAMCSRLRDSIPPIHFVVWFP